MNIYEQQLYRLEQIMSDSGGWSVRALLAQTC